MKPFTTTTAAACVLMAAADPAAAQRPVDDRVSRGEAIVRTLNAGQPQPALEGLRREFPFLADAIAGYALGEVWARPVLDHRTRQIAAVAAFAALGLRPFLKVHAGYALSHGVSAEELKEIVYLTTVSAGFPRAIEAAQALTEVFEDRSKVVAANPYVGMWVTIDGNIRHELLPNGRYVEARGTREKAYQGRYTVTGSRIDYVDDTGFTADGTFEGDVLYHGGMVFYRRK
jgi:4-carboxymuconolactone decarboxylase